MTVKRNSPCPCGSGKKYKKCCLLNTNSIESNYSHAVQLYNAGQIQDALIICHNILSADPTHKNARFLTGAITYNKAVTLQQSGQLQASIKTYSEALKLCPDESDIHANMGSAYYDLGKYLNALEHYLTYLEKQPNDFPVANRVAQIMLNQGDLSNAKQKFENIVAESPKDITALEGLAKTYEQLLDRDAAIRQYQTIVSINDDPTIHLQMLRLMIERGQLSESEKKLSELITRFNDNQELYFLLADIYRQSGLIEKSQDIYKELSKNNHDDINILLRWANFKEQVHQLDDAEQLINKVLKHSHENEEALLLAARIHRRKKNYDKAQTILEKIKPDDNQADDFSVRYFFELGSVLDKAALYSDAFKAMSQANQLAINFKHNHFDMALQKEGFKHIKQVLNKDVLQQFSGFPEPKTDIKPLFIVGFPRSGTSLLEQIFASHSKICAGDELPFMSAIENHYCQTTLKNQQPFPDCFTGTQLDIDMVNLMRKFYLDGVKSYGLPSDGKKIFTDKMPLNLLYLGMIHLLFPSASIIHIRRHPLDVCLSAFFTNFTTGNRYAMRLEDTASYYSEVMALTEHYKQHLNLNYIEVRYEDLVTNTEAEIKRLLDFIGLEWDENCLSHHLTKRISKTSSYEQVTKAMYTSSISRHDNYQSELNKISPILDDLIRDFGHKKI